MKIFNEISVSNSTEKDLYQYRCYIQSQPIITDPICSYWYLNDREIGCFTGDDSIFEDFDVCVEIFGYTPETRTSTYTRGTDLPYLNGCSTKQLIPPNRLGDPTWQLLQMQPNTTEQKHHVHSTARVVYVISGSGYSMVGMSNNIKVHKLSKGMVLILDKLEPHHFVSSEDGLLVAPLHIFSSSSDEFNHPMFNGTHEI